MTESDAYEIATQDATSDTPRLGSAKTPQELADAVFKRFLYRIKGLNDGEAHKVASETYREPEIHPSEHLSLFLSSKAIAVLEAASGQLHPEDIRALLLWLTGSHEHGPGYLQHILQQIPDSGTPIALQQLGAYAGRTYQALDQRDKRLFGEMISTLPHGASRTVRGMLMEAKWCDADGDGEGARIKIIGARKLATMLLKNQMRNNKLFYREAS